MDSKKRKEKKKRRRGEKEKQKGGSTGKKDRKSNGGGLFIQPMAGHQRFFASVQIGQISAVSGQPTLQDAAENASRCCVNFLFFCFCFFLLFVFSQFCVCFSSFVPLPHCVFSSEQPSREVARQPARLQSAAEASAYNH